MNISTLIRRPRAPHHDDEVSDECPPHDFTSSWGSPAGRDVTESEAVPVIYCTACGDIRPLRIPSELSL